MKIEINQFGSRYFSVDDLAAMNSQGLAAAVMEAQREAMDLRWMILEHNKKEHSAQLEIRFTLELSGTDTALLVDSLDQDGIKLEDFAKNEVAGKIERLVSNRKREIGQILAMKGGIDEEVRLESSKLAEARKSPW